MAKKTYSRDAAVKKINSWIGLKTADGSYKKILEIYNSQKTKPRGVTMKPGMAWCAATVSAVAIALRYDDIFPIECSCSRMIAKAIKMGIWIENDGYVPSPGDLCMYDWDDNGKGDNKGTPDHVGMVTYVNKKSGYFVVTEGNYSKSVKKRTIAINGKFIRGFVTPKYTETNVNSNLAKTNRKKGQSTSTLAHEIITGVWGSDKMTVKANLAKHAYTTTEITAAINAAQKLVNTANGKTTCTEKAKEYEKVDREVKVLKTTASTSMRNGAGDNKALIVKVPKGATVKFYGYFTKVLQKEWYVVECIKNGVTYTGFVSAADLK